MFASLTSDFDKQNQFIEECFSLWQRSKSAQLTTTIKTTLSKVRHIHLSSSKSRSFF